MVGFLCLRVGCFPGDALAKRSFFAGLLSRGCLFLEPSAAISVAPCPSTPNLCPCDYSPYTMLLFFSPYQVLCGSSNIVSQLCLLFQYNLVPEFVGHQYFWFQFHSKFYLSDLSGCVPVVEAWFRFFDPCLGVCYDLFQCVVVPVSVCSRSVACVCVCCACVSSAVDGRFSAASAGVA